MPDLISHVASGFICRSLFPRWKLWENGFPLVLFGIVLPDLLSRSLVFFGGGYALLAQYFHTPFACLLQTLIISGLFAPGQKMAAFRSITLGWVLHQTFDLFQNSLDPGFYYIFWPFYNEPVKIGLFWNGYWPYVMAVTVLTAILLEKWKIFLPPRHQDTKK